MKTERWQQINDLFQSAAERAPDERAAFLDEACHGDERLCHDVKLLIASYERTENFIEAPAFEEAPELLTNDRAGALVGELMGHYRIESLIGVGGMGEVYLARDDRLGRKVALKLLPLRLTTDETQLSRFKTEARTASALNHPNILTVYEIGAEGDRHFIATEFIEGVTLRESLARGRIDLHHALEIAVQVASALAAAHETGIVHRDIKPENIMLRPDGYAKVLDFGIAKLALQQPASDSPDVGTAAALQRQSDLVVGTARYMSPEQMRGQQSDARSDVWSLGVVLYEMVAGIPPFSGATTSDCIASILKMEPAPLSGVLEDVPVKLQSIVQKALRKNRDERYQTTSELLADLRNFKRELEADGSSPQTEAHPVVSKIEPHKRGAFLTLAAAILAAAAFAYSFYFVAPAQLPNEKSIAVLPFADLSPARDQEYFCDGVQDEILTNLSRVAHLKVISRVSVMQYKSGVARNLRKIGQQLGVGHVVEGSVQRSGNRVRVNAQLVDARSDRHLWAQTYDRDPADVFAIQSEIAEHIVSQLRSKLSPQEKEAIEEEPTADLAAHDLYIRAKILIAASHYSTPRVEILLQAVHLLNQAIERDPAFALAYYQLAHAHDQLYFGGTDHTPARLALADAAIQSLVRLRPNSGEAHLALAKHLYWGYLDYDHAREELSLAQKSLPNEPWAFVLGGFIDRRQGRWAESIKNLERAIELDPQNGGFLGQLAFSYSSLRRYANAERILNRAIALVPKDTNLRVARAAIELDWHADPHPLISTIEGIVAQDSREAPNLAGLWIFVLLCERDSNDARRALAVLSIDGCYDDNVPFPRAWCEGVVAQMRGDKEAARAAFTIARTDAAKLVAEQPDYAEAHCVLGMAEAALGNKEDAISEGRRAVELLPVTKDAMGGAMLVRNLAIIYAWTGEKDLAFEQLAIAAGLPGSFSYGQLKLLPFWDALRGDPRFEKIVASLAPKE